MTNTVYPSLILFPDDDINSVVPYFRSVGGHFHLVGPLTVSNYLLNPGMELASSGNITNWDIFYCSLTQVLVDTPTGGPCGLFTANSLSSMPSIGQTIDISQAGIYTMSLEIRIPLELTTGITLLAYTYDVDDVLRDILGGEVLSAYPTDNFVRVSNSFPISEEITTVVISLTQSAQPSDSDSFYIRNLQFELSDTPNPYVDGNMSGYVWASTRGNSRTLKTEYPSALYSFNSQPLAPYAQMLA